MNDDVEPRVEHCHPPPKPPPSFDNWTANLQTIMETTGPSPPCSAVSAMLPSPSKVLQCNQSHVRPPTKSKSGSRRTNIPSSARPIRRPLVSSLDSGLQDLAPLSLVGSSRVDALDRETLDWLQQARHQSGTMSGTVRSSVTGESTTNDALQDVLCKYNEQLQEVKKAAEPFPRLLGRVTQSCELLAGHCASYAAQLLASPELLSPERAQPVETAPIPGGVVTLLENIEASILKIDELREQKVAVTQSFDEAIRRDRHKLAAAKERAETQAETIRLQRQNISAMYEEQQNLAAHIARFDEYEHETDNLVHDNNSLGDQKMTLEEELHRLCSSFDPSLKEVDDVTEDVMKKERRIQQKVSTVRRHIHTVESRAEALRIELSQVTAANDELSKDLLYWKQVRAEKEAESLRGWTPRPPPHDFDKVALSAPSSTCALVDALLKKLSQQSVQLRKSSEELSRLQLALLPVAEDVLRFSGRVRARSTPRGAAVPPKCSVGPFATKMLPLLHNFSFAVEEDPTPDAMGVASNAATAVSTEGTAPAAAPAASTDAAVKNGRKDVPSNGKGAEENPLAPPLQPSPIPTAVNEQWNVSVTEKLVTAVLHSLAESPSSTASMADALELQRRLMAAATKAMQHNLNEDISSGLSNLVFAARRHAAASPICGVFNLVIGGELPCAFMETALSAMYRIIQAITQTAENGAASLHASQLALSKEYSSLCLGPLELLQARYALFLDAAHQGSVVKPADLSDLDGGSRGTGAGLLFRVLLHHLASQHCFVYDTIEGVLLSAAVCSEADSRLLLISDARVKTLLESVRWAPSDVHPVDVRYPSTDAHKQCCIAPRPIIDALGNLKKYEWRSVRAREQHLLRRVGSTGSNFASMSAIDAPNEKAAGSPSKPQETQFGVEPCDHLNLRAVLRVVRALPLRISTAKKSTHS